MKNSETKSSSRCATRFRSALLLMLVSACGAAWPADGVAGEEQAVVQALATMLNQQATAPYDFLYFESDFTTSPHVASSMANPDRTEFCGLTRPQAQTLVTELTEATSRPVEFSSDLVKPAGLKVGHKKLPKFRYLFVSRVIFAPDQKQAWLAVDMNGETGAVLRLDKVNGQWSKAARCGGWVRAG
jgi:hypothetical protein